MIVRGPDAYVSPTWYASKAEHGRVVPTWNYVTAHVYGDLIVHDAFDAGRAAASGPYDLITCCMTIEHVPAPAQLCRDAFELLIQRVVEAFNLRRLLEVEFAGLAAGRLSAPQSDRIRANGLNLIKRSKPPTGDYWRVDDEFTPGLGGHVLRRYAVAERIVLRRWQPPLGDDRGRNQEAVIIGNHSISA